MMECFMTFPSEHNGWTQQDVEMLARGIAAWIDAEIIFDGDSEKMAGYVRECCERDYEEIYGSSEEKGNRCV